MTAAIGRCELCHQLIATGHAAWCERGRPDEEWLRFARHQLPRDLMPTPQEAGESVVGLRARLREVSRELERTRAELERERAATRAALKQFAREVEALARKWERG